MAREFTLNACNISFLACDIGFQGFQPFHVDLWVAQFQRSFDGVAAVVLFLECLEPLLRSFELCLQDAAGIAVTRFCWPGSTLAARFGLGLLSALAEGLLPERGLSVCTTVT